MKGRKSTTTVRCRHCGRTYDIGRVTVTARYVDCSVWQAPCCGRTVEDRGETGWKSLKDYEYVSEHEPRTFIDDHGRMWLA